MNKTLKAHARAQRRRPTRRQLLRRWARERKAIMLATDLHVAAFMEAMVARYCGRATP